MHAVAGCGVGQISSRNCVAGAIGGGLCDKFQQANELYSKGDVRGGSEIFGEAQAEIASYVAGTAGIISDAVAAAKKFALREAFDPPRLTIQDHYKHHKDMRTDVIGQLRTQGYRVANKEASFGNV